MKLFDQKYYFLLVWLILLPIFDVKSQQTVFNLFKSDIELADRHYNNGNYVDALDLYISALKNNEDPSSVNLKIARCYYFLKDYQKAVKVYDKVLNGLNSSDTFFYAEAQAAIGDYKKAIESYKEYLSNNPSNELIKKKIWRLDNIEYLYENAKHFVIRELPINSSYGDLNAVPYSSGIVFVSNRKELELIENIDASLNAPFYRMYFSETTEDLNSVNKTIHYNKPVLFSKELHTKFHYGPAAFYHKEKKMVFATAGSEVNVGQEKKLQLYFAQEHEGIWKITEAFPFNDPKHSLSSPTITEDGDLLFFSSDNEGGYGGKDIYKSVKKDGNWTKPVNVGEEINTPYDEVFPYIHLGKTLYFSSNGHAGFGGLDIFKSKISASEYGEVENLGYPLNTNYDDFGITVDSLNTHGYLTSNRKNGGYNDDIYEFDMNIQPYPINISGKIKYIENNWADSSKLKILPNVKLVLIDNARNVVVAETQSDGEGNFTINVPYFSEYKLRVSGKEIGEGIVSFAVPKHKKLNNEYEIVVVKDEFRSY
ncbi:MAG: tetratricopeptide repeat protein [Candidatus Cyclobacteriaceae bacterium M2_1C_046]